MKHHSSLPPEVSAYFDQQKHLQNEHVMVAQSKRNVRETTELMEEILLEVGERGAHLDLLEDEAENLEDSSSTFLLETLPGWRRWVRAWAPPDWWFPSQCCRRQRQKRQKRK